MAALPADRAALQQALLAQYPGLVAVVMRRAGDRQLAMDLLQDAIVTALTRLDAGARLQPQVIAGFVVRTALNHLRNHQRRERRRVGGTDDVDRMADEAAAAPADAFDDADQRGLVRAALRGLPTARDREAVVRFYLFEQERAQVCEGLGLTQAQFDRVISRARERMRELLERSGIRRWDVLAVLIVLIAI